MKKLLLLCTLGCITQATAKTPKLYRCIQHNGVVVIQDRSCIVTDLHEAKPLKPKRRLPATKTAPTTASKQAKNNARRFKQANQSDGKAQSKRSPFFTFGWDRFIPSNWVVQKINTNDVQQLLLSRNQFKSFNDFIHGVKLSVYSNTIKKLGLDAFAQALQLYHQIRDNSNYKLIDSQFKSDPNFKVFNIKYQNQQSQLVLTEFYIDEANNDLFVVTIQARESEWHTNWQMAEKIINQL